MLITHHGESPRIDPTAYVAPNAVVCGDVTVGPGAHVVGSTIEHEVFLATGCAVFHGSRFGAGAEVRINGVVHLRTRVAPGSIVPIGWIAVGDPAQMFPASEHQPIWKVQEPPNFSLTVYGLERGEANMIRVTRRLSESLASHLGDEGATAPERA